VQRTGTVTGTAGLTCGRRCLTRIQPGAKLALRARPAPGSRFLRWERGTGTSPTCTRTVEGALLVRAVFQRLPQPCRCSGLTTSTTLTSATTSATGTATVRLRLTWRLRCTAGTAARCTGLLRLDPQGAATLSSPADRQERCDGRCPPPAIRPSAAPPR
jgi:hypothetical protein